MKFSYIIAAALLAMAGTGLTGCATTGSGSNGGQTSLAGGNLSSAYGLYYEQVKDQKRVDQIFITKSGPSDLRALTKEISTFSKAELEVLKSYEAAGVKLDRTGLPPAEIQARQNIEGFKTAQLLGANGSKFRNRLLATEVEAVLYAQAVAKVIADSETNPDRKAHLAQSAKKWEYFGARLDALLAP